MSNIRAIDPSAEMEFVPKEDKDLPKSEQLTIIYKQPTMKQMAEINDDQILSKSKGKITNYQYLISRADIRRLEISIVGWKNFLFPKGHAKAEMPVPFSVENITMLPPNVRDEFVDHITGRKKEEETELGEAVTE